MSEIKQYLVVSPGNQPGGLFPTVAAAQASIGGEQKPKKWQHKTLSTPAIVDTQAHGRGVVRDVWGYQSEASDPLAGYRVMSWEAE